MPDSDNWCEPDNDYDHEIWHDMNKPGWQEKLAEDALWIKQVMAQFNRLKEIED